MKALCCVCNIIDCLFTSIKFKFKANTLLNNPIVFNMERWQNKVAVVTGASAGIGEAVVKDLLKSGLIVVGLARRSEKIEIIRRNLPQNLQKNLHPIKCDVSDEQSVNAAFKWIDNNLGGVDILINNAGIVRTAELIDLSNTQNIIETLNTNVMGVVYCTRLAFHSMRSRNFDGHIIVVNSIAGHKVPNLGNLPSSNIYPSSKYAVTAMTEVYRQEFIKHGTKVKITSISPGTVDTDIFQPDVKRIVKMTMPLLNPEDVSSAIMYAIATPPHVQIHELTIKPVGEFF